MKNRKTIEVKQCVTWANNVLKSDLVNPEVKSGVCSFVEHILHSTNNYNGFTFLNNNDCEVGTEGYYKRIYIQPYWMEYLNEQRKQAQSTSTNKCK